MDMNKGVLKNVWSSITGLRIKEKLNKLHVLK